MSKLQEFVERKLAEYRAAKDTLVDDTSSVDFFMKNWKIRNIEGQFRRILQSVDLLIDEKNADKKSSYYGDLYKEDANIYETLTTEELIDNIQSIVDNTAEDLGDKEQNKIFADNSKRTLKNFNEKREIIQALFFEEQFDLKEPRLNEIFADSLYVDKAKKLNAKDKYFVDEQDRKITYDLQKMYDKIIENCRKVLLFDSKMLEEHGLTKQDFFDGYRTAAANILKSQIYQKDEQEFKDLVQFIETPFAVMQSKYPEFADEEKMEELGIKNWRDHSSKGARYLNQLVFNIKEISGVDQEQKEVVGTTEQDEVVASDDVDLNSSIIYDVDDAIAAEEEAKEVREAAVDISENQVLNEKFKEFNNKFGLNINYQKVFNILDNNFYGRDMDTIASAHKDSIKDMFNAMLENSEVAQEDVVEFGKEFKSLMGTLFEEKGDFDELENLKTAGIPVKDYNELVKNGIEKYKPLSINQYYVNRFKSLDDKEMSNVAYYARADVKDMLNPAYRNAVEGSRGFGYKEADVFKESAAILKALIQVHEERPSNYWWRHPIRNYRENSAIKNIRQQILDAGCKEETLNGHLNSKEIEEESYLQVKADFEVFERDSLRQKEEIDKSLLGEELESNELISGVSKQLSKDKSFEDLV
jgi:hypothetical protein